MNFLSMDYFVMVAKEKSFTKAAEKLHITQQTLSAHIKAIEEELNCQLLVRHVPLELTYAGEVFLKYASGFQGKFREMEQEFYDITNNQKGVLRIGIAYTRGRVIMPLLIEGFQMNYPNIQIQLSEAVNDQLYKLLLDAEIDLAIANFSEQMTGIELKDFYKEKMVMLISEKLINRLYGEKKEEVVKRLKAGDFSALKNCPFVLNTRKDISGRVGGEFLDKLGFSPKVVAQSDNVETMRDLCIRGAGACFCPENLVQTNITREELGKVRKFELDKESEYMIRFGYLKKGYQWDIISNFIKCAKGIMG